MSVDTMPGTGTPIDIDVDVADAEALPIDDEYLDPPDVDPLFSSVTGKTYKTERGKKVAESRFRNRGGKPASPTRPRSGKSLQRRLQSVYETVGGAVTLFSPMDGQVIIHAAPGCAEAVAEWAESDPRVRDVLEKMLTGSAVSKVIMSHIPIILGVMSNHDINPLGGLFLAVHPDSKVFTGE